LVDVFHLVTDTTNGTFDSGHSSQQDYIELDWKNLFPNIGILPTHRSIEGHFTFYYCFSGSSTFVMGKSLG